MARSKFFEFWIVRDVKTPSHSPLTGGSLRAIWGHKTKPLLKVDFVCAIIGVYEYGI
jgi:hypothetical protein